MVSYLVVHITDSEDGGEKTWKGIARYHVLEHGYATIGYHFGFGWDYERGCPACYTGRPITMKGAHAFGINSTGNGQYITLGFAVMGSSRKPIKKEVYNYLLDYLQMYAETYGLSTARIIGHREVWFVVAYYDTYLSDLGYGGRILSPEESNENHPAHPTRIPNIQMKKKERVFKYCPGNFIYMYDLRRDLVARGIPKYANSTEARLLRMLNYIDLQNRGRYDSSNGTYKKAYNILISPYRDYNQYWKDLIDNGVIPNLEYIPNSYENYEV